MSRPGVWSRLDTRDSSRHYLDGEPVHCGDVLELREQVYRCTEDREWIEPGPGVVRVRYEIEHARGGGKQPVLYTSVAGHQFRKPYQEGMFLRWPGRE